MPNEHPITPPPELVQRLRSEAPHGIRDAGVTRELHLITAAYRAGADQELEACCEWLDDDDDRTTLRAALAEPEPEGPTDKELLELMPETMRDEFSYAARVCSNAMAGRVKSGIFRVALNTAALEYARAVLARFGGNHPGSPDSSPADGEVAELVAWLRRVAAEVEVEDYTTIYSFLLPTRAASLLGRLSPPEPVPVSERLPGPEDCETHGWCWVLYLGFRTWTLEPPFGQDGKPTGYTHWLPADALPLPARRRGA